MRRTQKTRFAAFMWTRQHEITLLRLDNKMKRKNSTWAKIGSRKTKTSSWLLRLFFNFPLLPECVCWVCKNYDLQRALLKLYMASYGCARRRVVMR